MIKIIKLGIVPEEPKFLKYQLTCDNCKTEVSYEDDDLFKWSTHYVLVCPICLKENIIEFKRKIPLVPQRPEMTCYSKDELPSQKSSWFKEWLRITMNGKD